MTITERMKALATLTADERLEVGKATAPLCVGWYESGIEMMESARDAMDAKLREILAKREPELGPWIPRCESFIDPFFVAPWSCDARTDMVSMWAATNYARNGNCFRTDDEAKREFNYTRAHRRLRQIAAKLNATRIPITLDSEGFYSVWVLGETGGPYMHRVRQCSRTAGSVYFYRRQDAERAIEQLTSEGIEITWLFT